MRGRALSQAYTVPFSQTAAQIMQRSACCRGGRSTFAAPGVGRRDGYRGLGRAGQGPRRATRDRHCATLAY